MLLLVQATERKHFAEEALVQDDIEAAKKAAFPPDQDLYNNIYQDGLGVSLRNIDSTKQRIQLPKGVGTKH